MARICATCGGMLMRDRLAEEWVCAMCGRSLTGTREPTADDLTAYQSGRLARNSKLRQGKQPD